MIVKETIPVEGRTILLEALDARTVAINSTYPVTELVQNNKIVGLSIATHFLLNINEPLFSDIAFKLVDDEEGSWSTLYHVTSIIKLDEGIYTARTGKLNNCSFFMLPILGNNREFFAWDWALSNVFITHWLETNTYTITLSVKFYRLSTYYDLQRRLKAHPHFLQITPFNHQHDLYHFTVPPDARKDFAAIMNGKYSSISDKLKQQILKFHHFSSDGTMAKILNKDKSYRRQLELNLGAEIPEHLELYTRIDLDTEVLHL